MVKFNLITGFLGSGKTSLLKNLLSELSRQKRIAVIQNEFAPTSVDSKDLQQNSEDFKLVEINNGLVFCVCQLSNFEQTLDKLLDEYQPEIVFLEASGLADPISIAELLQTPSLSKRITLDKSICLVDAANYFKGLSTLVRFKHQIMVADVIILNKIDLFDGDIEDIKQSVSQLNPFADILPSVYAEVSWEKLSDSILYTSYAAQRFKGQKSEGVPDMNACVLRVHNKIDLEALKLFVEELQEKCLRIKGFVNLKDGSTVLLQSVFNKLDIEEVNNYSGRTEIIAFGFDINIGYMRQLFKKFSNELR